MRERFIDPDVVGDRYINGNGLRERFIDPDVVGNRYINGNGTTLVFHGYQGPCSCMLEHAVVCTADALSKQEST